MKIYLGDKDNTPIYKELSDIKGLLLAGGPGGGKTAYLSRLIKELVALYPPSELKFMIFDGKSVDYFKLKRSPYLLFSITNEDKIDEFKKQLSELRIIADKRKNNLEEKTPIIVIIDEYYMLHYQYKKCSEEIAQLVKEADQTNIYFFISAQRAFIFDKNLIDAFNNKLLYWVIDNKETKYYLGQSMNEKLKMGGDVFALIDGKVERLQQKLFDGKSYL